MRFIKDLVAWKQQAEEPDPAERDPNLSADAAEDEAWDDDDEWDDDWDDDDDVWDDEDDDDDGAWDEDGGDDEDEGDTDTAATGPSADAAVRKPDRPDTYDLLNRVATAMPSAPPPSSVAPAPQPKDIATRPMPVTRRPEPPPSATKPLHEIEEEAQKLPLRPPSPPAPPPAPPPAAAPPAATDKAPERAAKIWDLPQGDAPAPKQAAAPSGADNPPQPPARTQAAASQQDHGPVQAAAAAPSAAAPAPPATQGSGRAKTRLLGFRMDAADSTDPFDAPAAAAQNGSSSFPTGWLVIIEGPGRGTCFTLGEGVSQIGRGEDQAVRLDFGDTSISRHNHAAVAYDPETGKFYMGHGGKSNLVRLNGRPVLATEEMASHDLIKIGETVLRFIGFCDEDFTWGEDLDRGENAKTG